jgi:hypothetical protein
VFDCISWPIAWSPQFSASSAPRATAPVARDQAWPVQRATKLAISYIPAAADNISVLMYRPRAMAPTQFGVLGCLVQSNLATIGAPSRDCQLLDAQEQARRTGMPTPAAQLTLGTS